MKSSSAEIGKKNSGSFKKAMQLNSNDKQKETPGLVEHEPSKRSASGLIKQKLSKLV